MEIRSLTSGDDRFGISQIYEESWKYAYKGIVPQIYLDSILAGQWAPDLDKESMHTLLLLRDGVPCVLQIVFFLREGEEPQRLWALFLCP